MTLDTFFKKFDQFAAAPGAVVKMRELVLELASKGALSERRTSDQADATWRKFTSEFDSRPGRLETDSSLPFEIPDVWRWVTLDDLGTTKIRNDVDDDTLVSFVPMTLISAKYGVPAQSDERLWREVKKGFTHFAEGDVVMAKITPCFENAKSAVMRNLVNGAGAGTTELLVFRGETKIILPEFVLIYLKTRGFISRGEPRMTGSAGQKRVPREYFAGSPFPLPPLAEQKRIVAKVGELMALCDRLEAQQQERDAQASALARASLARFAEAPTPANLNLLFHKSYSIPPADLRKAILAMAVQGKLVSQDPSDESAIVSLGRIESVKMRLQKSGEIGKDKPVDLLSSADLPFDIPSSWEWVKLADLTELITKGSSPKWQGVAYVSEAEGVLFITSENVGNYTLRKLDDLKYVEKRFNEIEPRSILKHGDILMNLVGASIGRTGLYSLRDLANINQAVALIRLVRDAEGICPAFLLHFLNSPTAIDSMLSSRVVTAQPNISLTDARNFAIPFPPLAEQRRIVAKVDQLMALVDQLETQLAASRATAKNLLEALVVELTSSPRAQSHREI